MKKISALSLFLILFSFGLQNFLAKFSPQAQGGFNPLAITDPKVIGQPDISETVPNQVVSNRVFHPQGVTIDREITPNRVYVWDSGNSRILAFSSLGSCLGGTDDGQPCTNNLDCLQGTCLINSYKGADIIIGQPDEFRASCNGDNTQYMPATAATLCSQPYPKAISLAESPEPNSLAVDEAHNLYVFDKWNHRVLRYDDPFSTDTIADQVWGQANFEERECNQGGRVSQNSLCGNSETGDHISGDFVGAGVDVDPTGNLWVSDVANHRVLRFSQNSGFPLGDGKADLVIGQADFITKDNRACISYEEVHRGDIPSSEYLCRPKSVRYSPHTNQLFVIDWPEPGHSFRVLIYDPPFINGMRPGEFIIGGQTDDGYDYIFNRPVGLEIDPSVPDAFWLQDSKHDRILYFVKEGSVWTATKVLSQPNLEKLYCGGFECSVPGGPPWMCEACGSAGGLGIDSAGNIYASALNQQQIMRFPAPITDAEELGGIAYASDALVLQSQQPSDVLPINFISGYGLSGADAALLTNYSGGQKQVFVADQHRLLFWNDYDSIPSGSGADGVLFQDDFSSQHAFGSGIFRGLEKDSQERIWMTKGDKVYVFNGPVRNGQAPDFEITPTIPLRFGGEITSGELIGLAYDEVNDALWVSDTQNYRVIRIHYPLDDSRREVDMVLGQPDLETTGSNRGMDTDHWPTCPNMVADGFGSLGLLRFDNYGNLYIIDGSHEGWQCSNNRLLEYDAEDLQPHPSKNFFEQGERVPKRVFGGSGFTSETKDAFSGPDSPFTPISVSFTKDNQMLMTVDAYGNPYLKRIFWYDNPIPQCDEPCRIEHSSILPIEGSQLSDSSFDEDGNLALLDHTWNRVLFFKLTSLPTFAPSATPTPSFCNPSMREYFDKGDANCDGRTDDLDYVLWWKAYGINNDGDFEPAGGDGDSDNADEQVWLANYGFEE